jgi:hypothetical protein
MQTKAIKGVSIGMIFARAGLATKTDTPGRTSKATDGKRDTINHRERRIIADYLITQPTPQMLFDRPQIGGLSDKSTSREPMQRREKVGVMPLKVEK